MEDRENGENETMPLKEKLEKIATKIKESWIRDCDETEYMKMLIKMLKEMLKKDSLEEYFSNDEETLNYFMNDFYKEVIQNILIQPIIYGPNGDQVAMELLLNTYKLFLKFHKNNKYAPLFERIREIFHSNSSRSYFKNEDSKNPNPIKKYDSAKFNEVFNSKFAKENKGNTFKVGDEVDIPIDVDTSKSIEKKSWVRGKIKEIEDDEYVIEYGDRNGEKKISVNNFNIYPAGVKTVDWDWRLNLKKYDVIDCYDRNRWYPSTIVNVIEEEINGFKVARYKVGFRLYPEHFKNEEDENDTYEKHLDIWKQGYFSENPEYDSEREQYFGDKENYDEVIIYYSKRIQKFNTFSKCQQKNLNYSYTGKYYNVNNNESNNPMKLMNEKLENDTEFSLEEFYNYEVDGIKNCIIGKNEDFQSYFALFLREIEKEGSFTKFIEILEDKPNAEEIYNIFFILLASFSYIHRDYFKENANKIKNALINFINGLDNKEMRNLPKDLIDIVSELLKKIISYNNDKDSEKEFEDLYDEMTLTLAMKTIKTSIFDRRLQGIKALNDYIEKNSKNKESCIKLVNLIKKNDIIQEIFGANYHSQLINKSTEIVKLLMLENELSEEDIKLIWSCTKRGDLEAKITISKLLSELADNLKEEYIEMLLNSIKSNIDQKIDEKEVELVYRLSIQGKNNEKNILICCEYLCQCLLSLKDTNISNNSILDKLIMLANRDDKYLDKILEICENCLKTNKNALLSYSILFEIMQRISYDNNNSLKNFIKDQHLITLFKENFYLYIKKAKKLLEENNISKTDGQIIDKYLIDGFSHNENINKRMSIFPYLINIVYKYYEFLPFLKDVLINNAVSPNDQLIFYEFVKNYIYDSNNNNRNDDENEEETNKQKEKIRQELFELISDNNQNEVTVEQLKLFIALFFEMNKDIIKSKKAGQDDEFEYNIIDVKNIDELKGLDKLWNIILKIKEEKVLSVAINIIFQIYKNKYVEKLLEKCSSLIKEENATSEVVDKCIILLKLIIIESEKKIFLKPKAHLSLLKNCLINLPLEIRIKRPLNDEDIEKHLLVGNTTLNNIKIMISNIYDLPPKNISFSLSSEYIEKIKTIKNLKNKEIFEKNDLDDNSNNLSLYELLLINNNSLNDIKPSDKITFNHKSLEREPLTIDDELSPKFKAILQQWFNEFTEGSGKMGNKAVVNFIQKVTSSRDSDEESSKVIKFIEENDSDNKGYLNEEEFLNFYLKSAISKKNTVWNNLLTNGYREDLKKKGEPYDIEYAENDKLPRYKLGNDLSFIQNLIGKYYQNPNENSSLYEFLLYLSTNKNIYNEVLNMYNEDNKDSFVNKALNDENKYIEQNYILIIIESIIQDLEIYLYNKYIDPNDLIILGGNTYKLLSSKYEPFDNEENNEKKINFMKNLIKAENLKKIINYVNNLLIKMTKDDDPTTINNYSILSTCCLRGLKIINITNNLLSENNKENQNCINELKEKCVYNLGFCNLSSLFTDLDIKTELDNISYFDLSKNLINYLNTTNNKPEEKDTVEKNKDFHNKCLDFLIDLLSSKKQLLNEYSSEDGNKIDILNDLFKNNFSGNNSDNKEYFINIIYQSIEKAYKTENYKYILLLYQISNSLLDNLLNFTEQKEEVSNNNTNELALDNKFFDLYNLLSKLSNEIKNKEKADNASSIEAEPRNNNAFLKKVFNLLMKRLSESIDDKEKKSDVKILLGLFKLFIIILKDNNELKDEILFKEVEGKTLFELLYKKCKNQISLDNKSNEESNSNDYNILSQSENDDNNEKKEDKFICLETIKEEKKEDTKSIEELNELCNDFILNFFKESNKPIIISKLLSMINLLKKIIKKNKNGNNDDSDSDDKNDEDTPSSNYIHNYSSRQHGHVGLKNLGCICYMNSIMQQIYMVPTFRYAVMHADDGESPKPSSNYRYSVDDDNLLHQLQEMYTYLTFSEKMDYNPKNFCYSFKDFDGNPINVGAQQDSQEFYNNFCDKIENSLKKTDFKYIVSDVFTGRTCSSVLCQNCKNISNRFEDFYNLTLEVKNINNLSDSLQKLIVPEIIDDFQCSNCNQKVQIKKITSLNRLPNVLVVHLKRFYLDYETSHKKKINSKFEFPKKLNLKLFCVEEIIKNFGSTQVETTEIYNKEDEYYQYVLKGINVHTGSADGGHYFSFIDVNREGKDNIMKDNPDNKDNWLTFNDSHVSEFDTDKIPSECFGGSAEGYPFENCQNAYLLIYERKKKTPIRILINEKETHGMSEENIVNIDKENRNEIIKEYDLSRIGNNIDEEKLYQKIFVDKEKEEYYKYIPYYNIPKYAPRKVYNEVMKENNKTPSTKSSNKKNNSKFKKYKEILFEKIKKEDFDIRNENYDNESKENILSIGLNNFMKKLNKRQNWDSEEIVEINKEFSYLINTLIEPVIHRDTDISILKVINRALSKEDNYNKIFAISGNNGYLINNENIINDENVVKISHIMEELIDIFNNNKDNSKYFKELKVIFSAFFDMVKNCQTKSNSMISNRNENEKNPIIYIYQILYKLFTTNEIILSNFIDNGIIYTLLGKLEQENEEIRKIIYDILIYTIKKTNEYRSDLFALKEGETEGEYDFREKNQMRVSIDSDIINILFEEKKELLILLLIILEYDDESFMKEFNKHIYRLFDEYKNKNKEEDLIEILLNIIKIKDSYTLDRLYSFFGYPRLILRTIPREIKEKKMNKINSNGSDEDDNNDNLYGNRERDSLGQIENQDKKIQKWPLFGERLINGDINKHIYEYITMNHRKDSICLLSMLFPSEYAEIDRQLEKERKKNKERNRYYRKDSDDDDDDKKNVKIQLSEEAKKKILIDIINNIFTHKGNFALFKYIYLMPARTLSYNNLYEEIKEYLKEDINFENFKEKEEIYIKNIQKQINKTIEKAQKAKNKYSYRAYMYSDDDDEDDDAPPGIEEIKCPDKRIAKLIGFISDIIPGEIVREEISEIASAQTAAMYRIVYYTKYYKIDELKKKLLNKKEEKIDQNKEEKIDDKNDEEKKNEKEEKGKEEEKKEEKEKEGEKKEEIKGAMKIEIVKKKNENEKEKEKEKEKENQDIKENLKKFINFRNKIMNYFSNNEFDKAISILKTQEIKGKEELKKKLYFTIMIMKYITLLKNENNYIECFELLDSFEKEYWDKYKILLFENGSFNETKLFSVQNLATLLSQPDIMNSNDAFFLNEKQINLIENQINSLLLEMFNFSAMSNLGKIIAHLEYMNGLYLKIFNCNQELGLKLD